ncbi:hypothetical protein P1X14_04240 [Sphingomonas sp. AOB5]|uniref:hypothetical protein n=1 Tax=Sphingomonas sp. AOB5 TaxID=3034017 RepID=UPI0023F6704A|nr:hypothetical protein [Sphingomonas sp. AOB5]MDF7774446.1 hypothetical protein [Sphingomonas sp. AOB5]
MNFMNLLKSLDDLLFEIMGWLVFYPITFWRTIRHPWKMMDYASRELRAEEDKQYDDTLSPPLFLLLTLLLGHAVELALVGQSTLIADKHGLAALVSDDTSLLLLRLLIFSIFPMIMALRLVRKMKGGVSRETLRRPFYAQCYLAGPFALLVGFGGLVSQLGWSWTHGAGLSLIAVAFLWYGGFQARWFSRKLHVSIWRGFWIASVGMIECVVAILLVAPLLS